MENLFSQYPYALFFMGCFLFLIGNRNTKKTINANIIILYIIFCISSAFSVGVFWKNAIVILILMFIELEILSNTEEREKLVVRARYKVLDFIFIGIIRYKVISTFVISFFIYKANGVCVGKIWIWHIYISVMSYLFLTNIGRIYKNKFNTKNIDEIEKDYIKAIKGYKFPLGIGALKTKIELLLDIEDKTFQHRESSHTSICWECMVYKLNKDYEKVDKINAVKYFWMPYRIIFILGNIKKIIKLSYRIFRVLVQAVFSKESVRKYINRGYSTIEMQLVRTYGIISGYEHSYIRKIYELIYANMFFKSFNRKADYYHYCSTQEYLKYQIPYAYLKSVRSFIGGHIFRNIVEYYRYIREIPPKKKLKKSDETYILYKLSNEEVFIFILGLSMKIISKDILREYAGYIDKYRLNKRELYRLIKYIENN